MSEVGGEGREKDRQTDRQKLTTPKTVGGMQTMHNLLHSVLVVLCPTSQQPVVGLLTVTGGEELSNRQIIRPVHHLN